MATEFRDLLQKLSKKIDSFGVEGLVAAARLPREMRNQPAEKVLLTVGGNGDLSIANLDAVMDAMKSIQREDLYKEVKIFKNKSRKKLMTGDRSSSSPLPPVGETSGEEKSFDIAEREASQVLHTLERIETAELTVSVDRIKELHAEAKELAENLVRVVRRANVLWRSYSLESKPSSSLHGNSPPPASLTSSTEEGSGGGVVQESWPPAASTGGFRERLTRRIQASKPKPSTKKERTPSPRSQWRITRSQSERGSGMHPSATATLPLPPPPRQFEEGSGSDSEDNIHDYELTDPKQLVSDGGGGLTRSATTAGPLFGNRTRPKQVPQRQPISAPVTLPRPPLPHRSIDSSNSLISGSASTIPRKNSNPGNNGVPIPNPPDHHPQEDFDDDYEDVIGPFDQERSLGSTPHSKPQSLDTDILKGGVGGRCHHHDQSSTCSTPSSEAISPLSSLTKHSLKGKVPNTTESTPAIPIRRSSLKSGPPVGSSVSSSVGSQSSRVTRSETTTPNQPMVDIRQQIKEAAFKQKHLQIGGSPQSGSGSRHHRIGHSHPISLAKALEMSNSSDGTESGNCTEDSGYDDITPPVHTAWRKMVPPQTKKSTKQHSVEQQQSYTNITIIGPTTTTSPSPPRHTAISSNLGPLYGSNNTTPSPPNSTEHTTISAMSPMYNPITIEEGNLDDDEVDESCPEYVNVKQFVEPI